MAEAGETLSRIRQRLGHVPAFLNEVRDNPRAVDALWAQAESCWLDNPLPELFKTRLLAYLARFARNPYCRVYHSCRLWQRSVPARQVAALLHRPAPLDSEIEQHLQRVREFAARCDRRPASWPAEGSTDEWALFWLAVAVFIGRQTRRVCDGLREALGGAAVADLMLLLSFARTMHEWMEAHPTVRPEDDADLAAARKSLEAAEPLLRAFFDGKAEADRMRDVLVAETAAAELAAERRSSPPNGGWRRNWAAGARMLRRCCGCRCR